MSIYTIEKNLSFLEVLANFVLSQYQNTLELGSILMLLPNYQSTEALQDIFSQKSNLLPKIQPIEFIDPEALIFAGFKIKPSVSRMQRKVILISVMIDKLKLEPSLAFALLNRVEDILDDLELQKMPDSNEVISEVISSYHAFLQNRGYFDVVEYRNSIINGYAQLWSQNTPNFPIIAVGGADGSAAINNLLKTIAELTSGMVILPNIDVDMASKEWDAIDETHHQYNYKIFLEFVGVTKEYISYIN